MVLVQSAGKHSGNAPSIAECLTPGASAYAQPLKYITHENILPLTKCILYLILSTVLSISDAWTG
jgi:hypothetical protein